MKYLPGLSLLFTVVCGSLQVDQLSSILQPTDAQPVNLAAAGPVFDPAHLPVSSQSCEQLGWPMSPQLPNVCGMSPYMTKKGKSKRSFNKCFEFKTTWQDANALCMEMGGRLCSKEEMTKDVTAMTGCWFNLKRCWVADTTECKAGRVWSQAGSKRKLKKWPARCKPKSKTYYARCCADLEANPTLLKRVEAQQGYSGIVELEQEVKPGDTSMVVKGWVYHPWLFFDFDKVADGGNFEQLKLAKRSWTNALPGPAAKLPIAVTGLIHFETPLQSAHPAGTRVATARNKIVFPTPLPPTPTPPTPKPTIAATPTPTPSPIERGDLSLSEEGNSCVRVNGTDELLCDRHLPWEHKNARGERPPGNDWPRHKKLTEVVDALGVGDELPVCQCPPGTECRCASPTPKPKATPSTTPLVLPLKLPEKEEEDGEEDDDELDAGAAVKELIDASGPDAKDSAANSEVITQTDADDATIADTEGPPTCPEDYICAHGNCRNGTCFCEAPWMGRACNVPPPLVPVPSPYFVYDRTNDGYWAQIPRKESSQFNEIKEIIAE